MNYRNEAKQIIKAVGGRKNIKEMSQCATRLRFRLKDEEKIRYEDLKEMDFVMISFFSGDEYQILPKEGTNEIYQEMIRPSVGEKLFGDFWK